MVKHHDSRVASALFAYCYQSKMVSFKLPTSDPDEDDGKWFLYGFYNNIIMRDFCRIRRDLSYSFFLTLHRLMFATYFPHHSAGVTINYSIRLIVSAEKVKIEYFFSGKYSIFYLWFGR